MENKDECGCCCEEEKKSHSMTGMAVEIGDKAWSAVLQRRMEAMLDKQMGKQMDKVAAIMMEYVHKHYSAAMSGKSLSKSETDAFEKKLNAAMMG